MSTYPFNTFKDRRHSKYAVVIFVPKNIENIITPFRERYDPIYNLIPGHLTLMFPFETSLSLDSLSAQIKMETELIEPVKVELDSINDFYPKTPVIFWELCENKMLCELYYKLYSRLDIPIPYKQYIPHVTLAREISTHRVETVKDNIVSYLPREKFTAMSLDLITPLMNENWVSVRNFPFKKAE